MTQELTTSTAETTRRPGKVILLGSGETSATARRVYDRVLGVPARPLRVAVLETPAGFELNSDHVVGRIASFFQERLPHLRPQVTVVPARRRDGPFSTDSAEVVEPLWAADVIVAGPGSPTYAVRHLQNTLCWQSVLARHWQGATLILASAMTIAIGRKALPVYEIYKVGEDPHWKPGLDLFGGYGLDLVFVPHWNNREGGETLDTSHCYIGAPRFELLREQLAETTTVVGIDEYTAMVMDPAAGQAEVRGVGGVTVLQGGESTRFKAGARFPLDRLGPFTLPEAAPWPIPEVVWEAIDRAVRSTATPRPPREVLSLFERRVEARARRDWETADALRSQIEALGWAVEDTPEGSRLRPLDPCT
ncbi:MAG: hypothetical protein Kow0047_22170 [Anaerolineae bacterium]